MSGGLSATSFTLQDDATLAVIIAGREKSQAVHLKTQKPFDMKDTNGDPTYRDIPLSTPTEQLIITHDYYDHRDADKDINIVFPIDRLKELKDAGEIGGIAETNYGFMGHIDGGHIWTLINETAPEVAEKLRTQNVDAVLLTPG